MKAGMGKRKGGAFERLVAKQISLWWSSGVRNDLCWRSASSGARATVSGTRTKGYHGDLSAVDADIDPLFQVFSIEIKHVKEIDITASLRGVKAAMIGFYIQSFKSAIYSGRIPIVIAKENMYPTLLACPQSLFEFLAEGWVWKKRLNYLSLGNRITIFQFENLLESLDASKFRQWVKDYTDHGSKWRELCF